MENTVFERVQNTPQLKELLYDALSDARSRESCRELLHTLKSEKALKLSFNRLVSTSSTRHHDIPMHYIVTVHSHVDWVLIRLGKTKIGFPRGMHIVLVPGEPVKDIAGFLPKFDNSDMASTGTDELSSGIKTAPRGTALYVSLKCSGSLGLFMVYQPGVSCPLCYTAFSKNSACSSSPYVRRNNEMFRDIVSARPNLPHQIFSSGMTVFAAEVMYLWDQCHGARVKQETMVVTAGFQRHCLPTGSKMLCPVHPEWRELTRSFGLPLNPGFVLRLGHDDVEGFIRALCEKRDVMDLDEFEKLTLATKEQGSHEMRHDNGQHHIDNLCFQLHRDILGNVLEGLVLILDPLITSSQPVIAKFKFVNYLWRTMALRTLMEHEQNEELNTSNIANFARKFSGRWCSTEEGRVRAQLAVRRVMNAWVHPDGWLKAHLRNEHERIGVGYHILAADLYQEHPDLFKAYLEPLHDNQHEHTSPRFGTMRVIFVLGAIGAGKSTVAKQIVDLLGSERATNVDGDHIACGGLTAFLGQQRATSTLYAVLSAVMEGRIPVVSCGGGVLFDADGKLILETAARKMEFSGLDIMLVLAPGRAPGADDVDPTDADAVRHLCYQSPAALASTIECIERRKASGEWAPDVDSKAVSKRSAENFRFYLQLLDIITKHTPSSFEVTGRVFSGSSCCLMSDPMPQQVQIRAEDLKATGHLRLVVMLDSPAKQEKPASLHLTLDHSAQHTRDNGKNGAPIPVCLSQKWHDVLAVDRRVSGKGITFQVMNADTGEPLFATAGKKEKKDRASKPLTGQFVYLPDLSAFLSGGGAHLTQNPGPFHAGQMKDLARALDGGLTECVISLPSSGKQVKVAMKQGKECTGTIACAAFVFGK